MARTLECFNQIDLLLFSRLDPNRHSYNICTERAPIMRIQADKNLIKHTHIKCTQMIKKQNLGNIKKKFILYPYQSLPPPRDTSLGLVKFKNEKVLFTFKHS